MNDTRIPVQKRSIEKKDRILKAGFELFCNVGYSKTNTVEIAKRAGVSTGAVYCYFKDKRAIFITVFENYLENISGQLLETLSNHQGYTLEEFVKCWIDNYISLYSGSSHTLAQIRMMILEDDQINHHFAELENKYFNDIINIMKMNNIAPDDPLEKVYASCTLIDTLRQEHSAFPHDGMNYEVFKDNITKAVINMLS